MTVSALSSSLSPQIGGARFASSVTPPSSPPVAQSGDTDGGFNTQNFLDQFTQDFGEENIARITDSSGNVDFSKLKLKIFDSSLSGELVSTLETDSAPAVNVGGGNLASLIGNNNYANNLSSELLQSLSGNNVSSVGYITSFLA